MENKSNNGKSGIKYFTFETIIIILIAICVVAMINLSNYKINELFASHQELLLSKDTGDSALNEELANGIMQFRPDLCKMIELYSLDFQQILKLEFTKQTEENPCDRRVTERTIKDYPELMKLLIHNPEGHTTIRTEDEEEDVYFKHIALSNGQQCIMIIYMTKSVVKNLWVINFLGYFILILVFVLLIYSYHQRQVEAIKYYKTLSKHVQDKMIH